MATEYISRDAAILEFCDDCMDREWCKSNGESCSRIKNINAVPAADVRPVVSAEWERPKGSTPRSWIFVCSKCGDRAYFPVPKYFPKGCGYSFCPNCGADMREAGK